jgi:BatD DUF11 like domain
MLNRYLISLLCCLITSFAFASVQVEMDKNTLALDEVLTLTLSSKDHMTIDPDLTPLKKEFEIVGTNQSSQFTMINGTTQTETKWQISLLPKHAGDIVIPMLQIGREKTKAYLIHVSSAKNVQEPSKNKAIFIEANVVPKEIFIQEQVVYTLKLFFNRSLENPYLAPPDLADAKVVQNGQDIIYTLLKNGRYYRVLERSYLITPKNEGKFKIQPAILKGYLNTPTEEDLYGFSNSSVRPIKIVGPTLEIQVKPKPVSFTSQWFPAKKLTLSESWEPNFPLFRQGEPITRMIEVNAEGVTGEKIPSLNVESAANLNSYSLSPKRETSVNREVQVGKLTQKIVFIPTAQGKVILPPIKVHWWNSRTQQEQVTILPAKTIDVLPPLLHTSKIQPKTTSVQAAKQPAVFNMRRYAWPLLTFLVAGIWLITLAMWQRQVKTGSPYFFRRPGRGIYDIQSSLEEACLANNPKQTRRFLLEWAMAYWKNSSLRSLSDVVHHLGEDKAHRLLNEIMQLEAVFYRRGRQNWSGQAFWQAFQEYLKSKEARTDQSNVDPLPPLYF